MTLQQLATYPKETQRIYCHNVIAYIHRRNKIISTLKTLALSLLIDFTFLLGLYIGVLN